MFYQSQGQGFPTRPKPPREPNFCLFPVYSRHADTDLRQFLSSAALNRALKRLQLTEDESLHIYRNGIVLYLKRNSKNDVMLAIEVACRLTEHLAKRGDKEQLDLIGLPRKFENLFGLIPKWAISDDEMRGDMLSETSQATLQSFVNVVRPYLPDIDEFLDSFGEKEPPEGAVALGALAECCLEAQIRLRDSRFH